MFKEGHWCTIKHDFPLKDLVDGSHNNCNVDPLSSTTLVDEHAATIGIHFTEHWTGRREFLSKVAWFRSCNV